MSNILGHIVCVDDDVKKKLKDDFTYINFIDIDLIQNMAYNDENIQTYKNQIIKLSEEIKMSSKKLKILINQENNMKIDTEKIIKNINKKKKRRATIRSDMKSTWKETCKQLIDKNISKSKITFHLFIGYNVYPYDHRIKIDLGIKMRQDKIPTHIIYDIDTETYAENQIRFYLKNYQNKIIRGEFNLNLLKKDHIIKRFEKLLELYDNIGYKFIASSSINSHVYKLYKIVKDSEILQNRVIYFTTFHRVKNLIPVNSKTPLEGFHDRDEAILRAKNNNKKNLPIYLYKTSGENFKLIGNKLYTYQDCAVELSESIMQ